MVQQQVHQHRLLLWLTRVYMPQRTTRVSDHLNCHSARTSPSQQAQWVHDRKLWTQPKVGRASKASIFLATSHREPPSAVIHLVYLFVHSFFTGNIRLAYWNRLDWTSLIRCPTGACSRERCSFFPLQTSFRLHPDTIFMCSLYSSYDIKVYFIIVSYT